MTKLQPVDLMANLRFGNTMSKKIKSLFAHMI